MRSTALLLTSLLNAALTAAPGPEVVPHLRAEGLLYFVSAGSSIVVRAGPKCEVVAVSNLGGGDGRCGPSAAVSNKRIFVRDFNFLYCIGKE